VKSKSDVPRKPDVESVYLWYILSKLKMADNKTFMDKGLEEIILEKGIEKPNSRKRKYRSSPNGQKFVKKNPNFQKRNLEAVTEDLRNRIGGKYSVLITGLARSVVRSDLEELFCPFAKGGTIGVKMHFNSHGYFNGSAEVDLPSRENAIQAAETYNKVDLDDSTMTVIVTEQEAKSQDENNGPGCSKNFDQRIKRFKETAIQRNKISSKEFPKVEDLDAEIEEYMGNNRRKFNNIRKNK